MSLTKSAAHLRKFGFTMAGAFAVLGGLSWWRNNAAFPWLLALAGAFALPALVWPQALKPVEAAWMKVAHVMGAIMTRVLLFVSFYAAITPLAFLFRIMGKDSLLLKVDRARKSYWIPVEPDGPCSRPEKPY